MSGIVAKERVISILYPYILKAKKFAEPLFQSKKIAEKVRKSGRHFWAIWGNCGPFWVIFGPLWIILGHFVAFLDKFAESSIFFAGSLGSRDSLLECMGLMF